MTVVAMAVVITVACWWVTALVWRTARARREQLHHAGHGCSRDRSLSTTIDRLELELGIGWETPGDPRAACAHRDFTTVTVGSGAQRWTHHVCRGCGAQRTATS